VTKLQLFVFLLNRISLHRQTNYAKYWTWYGSKQKL